MIRALGLPHLGQTSRWGAAIFGVLLRFWRRSVGIDSGCIGVSPIISNRRGQANLCGTRRGLTPAYSHRVRPPVYLDADTLRTDPAGLCFAAPELEAHHGDNRRESDHLVNRDAGGDRSNRADSRKSLNTHD